MLYLTVHIHRILDETSSPLPLYGFLFCLSPTHKRIRVGITNGIADLGGSVNCFRNVTGANCQQIQPLIYWHIACSLIPKLSILPIYFTLPLIIKSIHFPCGQNLARQVSDSSVPAKAEEECARVPDKPPHRPYITCNFQHRL